MSVINYSVNALCRSQLQHEPHPWEPGRDCNGLPAASAEARKIVSALLACRFAFELTSKSKDEQPDLKLRVGPAIWNVLRTEILPDSYGEPVSTYPWPVKETEVIVDNSLDPAEWRLSVAEGKMS